MCNKKALDTGKDLLIRRYKRHLRLEDEGKYQPHWYENAFDAPEDPIISGPGFFDFAHWGLVPFWVKDQDQMIQTRGRTVNAKAETVFELPSFRESILRRRCLVPATGFFEHMHLNSRTNIPFFIQVPSMEIFSFAGIWDLWKDPVTRLPYYSYSILTVPANALMSRIHNSKKRMPLVLQPGLEEEWIRPDLPQEEVRDILKIPGPPMVAHSVSRLITSRVDNPDQPAVQAFQPWPELEGADFSATEETTPPA
ncbi:MAG TPA: SOS response-associated peptidase [Chitinophagaceae bacterium]|nr:SOS response-associated peptidase [Chitinophagaceae bacterium]